MSERVDPILRLPCGGTALFDGEFSYRCMDCLAVIGSIGQPRECVDEASKYDNWEELGGRGWDYIKGKPA